MTDFNHLNGENLNEQTDPADAIVNKADRIIEEAEAREAAGDQAAGNAEQAEAVYEQAAQNAEQAENGYEQAAQQAEAYEYRSAGQPDYTEQPQYNPPYGGRQPNYSSQNPQYQNQQQYAQGQYRPPYNGAPYSGQQPQYNPYIPRPVPQGYVQKNRILAGLFGILFGGIGLHNFYLGFTTRAVIQIVVSIVTCGLGSLWGFVEGIMIIAGYYNNNCDANGILTKEM